MKGFTREKVKVDRVACAWLITQPSPLAKPEPPERRVPA